MRCFHFATVILYSELPQATLCPAGIDQAHSADAIYVLLNMCSCHQIFIKEPLHQERPIRCSENKMKHKTHAVCPQEVHYLRGAQSQQAETAVMDVCQPSLRNRKHNRFDLR